MFRRFNSFSRLMLVTTGVLVVMTDAANGQNGQPRVAVRPNQGQNLGSNVVLKTPKEMDPVLQEWEQKTAHIESLKGSFSRFTYDSVFGVEKRAKGNYWFKSPDKAKMEFLPDPVIVEAAEKLQPGQKLQHKVGEKPNQVIYEVVADEQTSWICTGSEILALNHAPKTYSRMEIPQQYRGQRITDGPLPFLFGMKAESVKKRYAMTFGSQHNPSQLIHIVAFPLVPALQKEFIRAELMLDPNTFMPRAVRLWDPTGNKQTSYVFDSPQPFTLLNTLNPPWAFRAFGWTKIHDQKASPEQLPMHEQRNTYRPETKRTVESPGRVKIQ